MKIVIDKNIPFIKGAFEKFADVLYLPGKEFTKKDVNDADALIIRTRTKCNAELLSNSSVKVIASATIGFDHIDTGYCDANNIYWSNAKGCNSKSVYQYVISALMNLSVKHNFKLSDKVLGIVGKGNIGTLIKMFADIVGMKVLVCDPPLQRNGVEGDFCSYQEVLQNADIITFHVPLFMDGDDKTYHLLDADALGKLKKGTFIINSSRGEVVDNKAILSAIKNGVTGGVVLDVWENEPQINEELVALTDLATPHIAGYSADGKANGTEMSVRTVAEKLNLPLKNWKVESIPEPENKTIVSESAGDLQDCLAELATQTYPIENDSKRLKEDMGTFEALRNGYQVRREFPAFKVKISNENPEVLKKLSALGFTC